MAKIDLNERLKAPHPLAEQWAGEACTLNGKPAKVQGRLNRFALVATLECHGSVYFAWETVDRIMSRDRAFRS